MAEVDANDALTPFAIYDGSQLGLPEPDRAPIGFAVIEVVASVGFVLRLLFDADSQGRALGRAALSELVRRLRLNPDVELIATSYREDNLVMAGCVRAWASCLGRHRSRRQQARSTSVSATESPLCACDVSALTRN